jgi:hypothetical protein
MYEPSCLQKVIRDAENLSIFATQRHHSCGLLSRLIAHASFGFGIRSEYDVVAHLLRLEISEQMILEGKCTKANNIGKPAISTYYASVGLATAISKSGSFCLLFK